MIEFPQIFNWKKILIFLIAPFVLIYIIHLFFYFHLMYKTGDKPIQKETFLKKRPLLLKLFVDFPKQWAHDKLYHDPNKFDWYGIHFFGGPQGSGKTMSLVYMMNMLQKDFPKLKVRTNFNYKYQDAEINSWQDVVFNHNGEYGMIDAIDEIQNWFSSMQSKNFPPAMLSEITQQRKQRKVIFATGQVFTRVAKPIREQVFYYYEPVTLFGSLTILKRYQPKLDDAGQVLEMKLRKIYVFVQNKELREAYDTYQKIIDISKEGFIERDLSRQDNVSVYLNDLHQ